jgi:hypothetical protein
MSKKPIQKCYNCKHGGTAFKVAKTTHLHCEHPDEKIAGEPGWGTLREWFGGCASWEAKEKAEDATVRTIL